MQYNLFSKKSVLFALTAFLFMQGLTFATAINNWSENNPGQSSASTSWALNESIFKGSFGMYFNNAVAESFSTDGDCLNENPYMTADAPIDEDEVIVSSCSFAGDYQIINNAVAGVEYKIYSNETDTYLTIREGTYNGPIIAQGTAEVFATPTASGNIYIHVNSDENCGTEGGCRGIFMTCMDCQSSDTCFEDDFSEITIGDNTTTEGSGTEWAGNVNFPVVDKAYQANGAVRLGTGSANGSIESREFDEVSGDITINILVKGWNNVGGSLNVSIDGSSETVVYTATMQDDFEEISVDFIGVSAGSKLLISTVSSSPRTFIDNIEIICGEEDTEEPATGCLEAPQGEYPMGAYTPVCYGAPEVVTPYGLTGEFSTVNVTAGVEYTFTSSVPSDYITISDEEGTVVYASGYTPLTWTATDDEVVRFYLHLDDECHFTNAGMRQRAVQCGEPVIIEEPDYDCFQGDGILETVSDALNINETSQFRVADDFFVEEGVVFTLRQITMDVNQQEVPDNANLNIRGDNNGKPGAILETISMAPTSAIAHAEAYGDPIYHLTFDLDTPITLEEGTYWLEPTMTVPSGDSVWWIVTDSGSHGSAPYTSSDHGETWMVEAGVQMVFFVAGDCDEEELGIADLNSFDFAYYPNPVRDVLNITSQKEVESVSAFNLTGQKVMNNAKVVDGQIDVSNLSVGTYVFRVTLDDGQVETFKIIKR